MMYNNGYLQNQQRNNGIIWVQGVEGAKAYQLYPNSNALLMDSENDGIFYIKTSDNIGMCNLRTFRYSEITQQPKVDMSQYVTRAELEEVLKNVKSTVQTTEQPGQQSFTKHNSPAKPADISNNAGSAG